MAASAGSHKQGSATSAKKVTAQASFDELLRREGALYRELKMMRVANDGQRPTKVADKRRWNDIMDQRESLNNEAVERYERQLY